MILSSLLKTTHNSPRRVEDVLPSQDSVSILFPSSKPSPHQLGPSRRLSFGCSWISLRYRYRYDQFHSGGVGASIQPACERLGGEESIARRMEAWQVFRRSQLSNTYTNRPANGGDDADKWGTRATLERWAMSHCFLFCR
jgi:hypothetical protein